MLLGKSVLTNPLVPFFFADYCRKLQRKQEHKHKREKGEIVESSSDSDVRSLNSDEEQDFLNHPFMVAPAGAITLNIPVRTTKDDDDSTRRRRRHYKTKDDTT